MVVTGRLDLWKCRRPTWSPTSDLVRQREEMPLLSRDNEEELSATVGILAYAAFCIVLLVGQERLLAGGQARGAHEGLKAGLGGMADESEQPSTWGRLRHKVRRHIMRCLSFKEEQAPLTPIFARAWRVRLKSAA
jgi:hypothetical protein